MAHKGYGHKGGHGHHTGKPHRGTMHLKSHKGKDGMIHPSHHAANADHDMHDGFSPGEEYQDHDGDTDGMMHMGENEASCD